MLTIHLLNVEHGDSIVLEHKNSDNEASFAVIDSNCRSGQSAPALIKLKELGAQKLSFVMLTHPHADHYRGLFQILQEYKGRIGQFLIFPIGEFIPSRIKQLSSRYQKLIESQDDAEVTRASLEFLQILKFCYEELRQEFNQCSGESSELYLAGFRDIKFYSILPPNKVKGVYFRQIAEASSDLVDSPDLNDLSIAIHIKAYDVDLILGGDGSLSNWMNHRRRVGYDDSHFKSKVVKLPHHGSAKDSGLDVVKYLFADSGKRVAAISANGQSHPDPHLIQELSSRDIAPYCTNLMTICGARVRQMVAARNLDPELAKWINQLVSSPRVIQPCQGNVSISIDSNGEVSVEREFNNPCGFRGDFSGFL